MGKEKELREWEMNFDIWRNMMEKRTLNGLLNEERAMKSFLMISKVGKKVNENVII